MAGMRRGIGESGRESDRIDAEAVARVALLGDDLPVAELPGPMREIKLLGDHCKSLVARRTALQSKLRWFVHEIHPGLHIPSRALRHYQLLDELDQRLATEPGVVAEIARDMGARGGTSGLVRPATLIALFESTKSRALAVTLIAFDR